MRPEIPSAAERKVIRWVFGIAFGVATVFVLWSWFGKRQECIASCEAKGFRTGSLQLNAGGRFNLGTHCVCEK
jgi:hypothetical protein